MNKKTAFKMLLEHLVSDDHFEEEAGKPIAPPNLANEETQAVASAIEDAQISLGTNSAETDTQIRPVPHPFEAVFEAGFGFIPANAPDRLPTQPTPVPPIEGKKQDVKKEETKPAAPTFPAGPGDRIGV